MVFLAQIMTYHTYNRYRGYKCVLTLLISIYLFSRANKFS